MNKTTQQTWKAEPVKNRYQTLIFNTCPGTTLVAETCGLNHAEHAARIVACVNACAGLADPAADLAALREALRDICEMYTPCGDRGINAMKRARAALARTERGQK